MAAPARHAGPAAPKSSARRGDTVGPGHGGCLTVAPGASSAVHRLVGEPYHSAGKPRHDAHDTCVAPAMAIVHLFMRMSVLCLANNRG